MTIGATDLRLYRTALGQGVGSHMPKISGNHTIRAMLEIRQRILSGALPGGMRLHEVPLAEMLAISRTPVREAMGRLAEEGLLDRALGGGYAVRTFGLTDVLDAIELRGVLEGTAVRLAAERGAVPERMARAKAIAAQIDACLPLDGPVDWEGYAEHNTAFHREIAGLAGSEVIRREVERAARLPFAAPSALMPRTDDNEELRLKLMFAQEQHRALLEAIIGREGARAEALAREHCIWIRCGLEQFAGPDAGNGTVAGSSVVVA